MTKNLFAKKILIIPIVILILVLLGFLFFKNKGNNNYILEKVVKGVVLKEISETGTIKASEELELGFKTAGKIEDVYVKTGDEVSPGQNLAKIDVRDLEIQLNQAEADLSLVRAKKSDAKVSLENARQTLRNIEKEGERNLDNVYDDAIVVLNNIYTKLYSAYSLFYQIQQIYFLTYQGQAAEVIKNRDVINGVMKKSESYLKEVKREPLREKIESALTDLKVAIPKAVYSLEKTIDILRSIGWRDIVSESETASLETQKTNINNLYSDIADVQQRIETVKVTNKTNIDKVKSEISLLENQLKEDKDAFYNVQILQMEQKISLLKNQIKDAVLKSPIAGKIIKVRKKVGEVVQSNEIVVSVLSKELFQIKADIYEGDIANVKLGNPVKIELVAFPDEIFYGKVISIEPAEKVIDEVVYYETTFYFENGPKEIRQGMTADIIIETDKKEDVLIVPKRAIEKINGQRTVKVLKNGKIEERQIETGLEGNDYVEVISGLSEGEEIIVGKKF